MEATQYFQQLHQLVAVQVVLFKLGLVALAAQVEEAVQQVVLEQHLPFKVLLVDLVKLVVLITTVAAAEEVRALLGLTQVIIIYNLLVVLV
jgi:hypothetical protein